MRVDDRASLKAEALAFLLEPLGVDATVGAAALMRLAKGVDAAAHERGCAALPPTGSTLPWVSGAVAACVEEHELVRRAADRGRTLSPSEAGTLRGLMRTEGLRSHLQAFEGVTVEALRADPAVVALAERLLPGVLEPCRRAHQEWPAEIWRSIRGIDLAGAMTDLRRRRGSRQAAGARELVLQHSVSAARDLRNSDLVTLLERVRDFVAAEESYEAALSVRPDWWRWLGPDTGFTFRSDRREALLWAIRARDTGTLSGSTLEMLADDCVRVVIEQRLATALTDTTDLPAAPATSTAARLLTGLSAVASRTRVDELRALESWYTKNAEFLDRVAAAMDARRSAPGLGEALEALADGLRLPSGTLDASRTAYRDIQSALRAEVEAHLRPPSYSAHAMESAHLVGVIRRIGALERELREAVRDMPETRGRLRVAIVGRTKSGKTTLRKALTRDADRTGIGRGAHRTTRKTSAFELGSVIYLDTPGVAAKDDDLDAHHARVACDIADAVIWNYADTLRGEESAELQRLLLSGKPLLAVVNVKERVDTPDRLRLFAERPERAFASAPGHMARIEQVSGTVGVTPPTVLAVHSGAAHEALSTADGELRDMAFRASRLSEMERSLVRLLAERAIPLRAVRLADGVRAPLAAFHDRAMAELTHIDLVLGDLEQSTPSRQAALLDAFQEAGRNTRDRLEAERHLARAQLADVVAGLGGVDHAQRWSDFITGLELTELVSGLEGEFAQALGKRRGVLRARSDTAKSQDDEGLHIEPRPDASIPVLSMAAVKGAATAFLNSLAAQEHGKGRSPGTGKANSTAENMSHVLAILAGAAKAVHGEVERARLAKDKWTNETAAEAEAKLDELFDGVERQLTRIIDVTAARAMARFDEEAADLSRTRERFEQLRRLRSTVRSALDSIDLVLVRRLLALVGGDPAAVHLARRTPGIELRVRTDASRATEVRALLQDHLVDVLTERIEIGNTDD